MCNYLWGTSAKRTGVCFLLGIDTFTVVHVDEIRKNRSYTRLDSQIASFTANEKIAKFGKFHILSAGNIWKIPNFAGKIWKIPDLASKIWTVQILAGKIWKILDLATHMS